MTQDRLGAQAGVIRRADALYVLDRVAVGGCCALVGVSNTGKSALMRMLASAASRDSLQHAGSNDATFVYADFNMMLEASEQGFYELILRAVAESLKPLVPGIPSPGRPVGAEPMLKRLAHAYETLVAPPSHFQISLSFSEGLRAVCEDLPGRLVLLFDEFDGPFEQIDSRVFLNLRALQDRYDSRLSYVTATEQRLSAIRRGQDVDEFVELFEPFTRFLGPLDEEDVEQVIASATAQGGYTFDSEDKAFVRHHADGHLGLLLAVCRTLGEVTGEPVRDKTQNWLIHRQVRDRLDSDLNVQAECHKLWDDLTEAEQDALLALAGTGEQAEPAALDSLREKWLLHANEDLPLSPVLESFVRRQRLTRRRRDQGVRIDVESGSVWVDGRQVPQLTDLEYKLLLLLYGRLNQICDKYQIVEAVWGEDYIDTVDDARIDKLLSRLRGKIEPDPSNPRYLITIRGRGYKLVGL